MDVATQTEKSYLSTSYRKNGKHNTKSLTEAAAGKDIIFPQVEVIKSCDFEVFGIVQDVSFRHYTLRRAQKLGIRGWCTNTDYGTVVGLIQGTLRSFEAMRIWLKYTGSPTSRIDKCVFGPTTELDMFSYDEFTIRCE